MNRPEILDAAKKCVCGQREQDYGTPENNFETIGLLWGNYLRAAHPELKKVFAPNDVTPKDVAMMMALMKIARIATGNTPDSFIDLAGYAACGGEIATQGSELKTPPVSGSNQCVMCGENIPEGSQVCPTCTAKGQNKSRIDYYEATRPHGEA